MTALKILVALLLTVLPIIADEDPTAVFSPHYHTKGMLYIPSAEVVEPFECWYDEANNRSRVDYYNGVVKTYQFPTNASYGVSVKIAPEIPVSDDSCWTSNGTYGHPVKLQGMLPNLTGFKFLGGDRIDDVSAERWEKTETRCKIVNRYTMWVRDESPARAGGSKKIPVRYDIKGYNTLLNAHFDHYYFVYNSYSTKKIADNIFALPEKELQACQETDCNNDVRKRVSLNPMMEFMHGEDGHVVQNFESFKQEHGRKYGSVEEETLRLDIFRMNFRFIESLNRANHSFSVAVNHLADRAPAELNAMHGQFPTNNNNTNVMEDEDEEECLDEEQQLPKYFNWVFKGAVTPVKDQGTCGSCYAFASTGAVEGAYFRKCNRLLRLSEQSLIDCTWDDNNRGCNGGRYEDDFKWIAEKGVPLDSNYGPYLNEDGVCHVEDVSSSDQVQIAQYKAVNPYSYSLTNDELIKRTKKGLVEKGPLSVQFRASDKAFTFYSQGVYRCSCTESNDRCSRNLEHSGVLVGFGEENGDSFWIVKNSWSDKWGLNGYILISQDAVEDCGLRFYPYYVRVEKCLDS